MAGGEIAFAGAQQGSSTFGSARVDEIRALNMAMPGDLERGGLVAIFAQAAGDGMERGPVLQEVTWRGE